MCQGHTKRIAYSYFWAVTNENSIELFKYIKIECVLFTFVLHALSYNSYRQ